MSDEQFKAVILHLRIMIGFLGALAGIVLRIAWEFVS
jgi:hypothetical protein